MAETKPAAATVDLTRYALLVVSLLYSTESPTDHPLALWYRRIFPSSYDVPSAAGLPPTPSDYHVATSLYARAVSGSFTLHRASKYYPTSHALTCSTGHSRLPAQCPVCEHSPLSVEDCKPNKALRTTIKVFLRTEEKKREQAREKQRPTPPSAQPQSPTAPQEADSVQEPVNGERGPSVDEGLDERPQKQEASGESTTEAAPQDQHDRPQKSPETQNDEVQVSIPVVTSIQQECC